MISLDCVKNILNSNQAERTFVVGLTMLSRFSHNFSCVACGVKSIHYGNLLFKLKSRGNCGGAGGKSMQKCCGIARGIYCAIWFFCTTSRKTTTFRHLKDRTFNFSIHAYSLNFVKPQYRTHSTHPAEWFIWIAWTDNKEAFDMEHSRLFNWTCSVINWPKLAWWARVIVGWRRQLIVTKMASAVPSRLSIRRAMNLQKTRCEKRFRVGCVKYHISERSQSGFYISDSSGHPQKCHVEKRPRLSNFPRVLLVISRIKTNN